MTEVIFYILIATIIGFGIAIILMSMYYIKQVKKAYNKVIEILKEEYDD